MFVLKFAQAHAPGGTGHARGVVRAGISVPSTVGHKLLCANYSKFYGVGTYGHSMILCYFWTSARKKSTTVFNEPQLDILSAVCGCLVQSFGTPLLICDCGLCYRCTRCSYRLGSLHVPGRRNLRLR